MEKHKCKLCFKSYANGRALGGHMRSHMMNLPIQTKQQNQPSQLRNQVESSSSASSSSDEEDEEEEEEEEEDNKSLLGYVLRENPKKSFRLADPEFAFTVDPTSSVVLLQDRESETESSKNPTRRRSKRTRKVNLAANHNQYHHQEVKRVKCDKYFHTESWPAAEPEPVSSVSDATTEHDVAFCLMMLSRDQWIIKKQNDHEEQEQENPNQEAIEKSVENSTESDEIRMCKSNKIRGGKYKCETCSKVFKSYQALGGHRASHKKIKLLPISSSQVSFKKEPDQLELENAGTSMADHRKIHECPVCFRVFSSGQALGGHKRSHVIGSPATPAQNSVKFGEIMIDLNLPAPVEDDEVSQIELSAVSDAEFVNHAT